MMPAENTILAAGARFTKTIQDSLGRELAIKRLGALDRLRIFKAIGSNLSSNAPYLGMAMLAFSVTAIDGIPVPAPGNEAQLEALIQKLGDEGIDAVADSLDADEAGAALTDDMLGN